jgi:hypothetical protein
MGLSLRSHKKHFLNYGKNWATPTSREIFSDGYYIDTIIRKDGKSRLYTLGVQVRYSEEDLINWSTPAASQRGDALESYLRRCINRIKQGGVAFKPPLQCQVEAERKSIKIDFKSLDYSKDTEDLIKEIMNNDQ